MSDVFKSVSEAFRRNLSACKHRSRNSMRARIRNNLITLGVEELEERAMLAVNLVKDINTIANTAGSNPSNIVEVGLITYFAATTDGNGKELWKSDGSAAGTVMVKDILPGEADSIPFTSLTNVNGTLYFAAKDGIHGIELWKSDGTNAGTTLVVDIQPGANSSVPFYLTNVNGTLYFLADDGISGKELWKSDGTAAGTQLVKDILPGITNSAPRSFTNVSGTLYFVATDGATGYELWKSNGTTAGTTLVKDIQPGNSGSVPSDLENANGTLYFSADDGSTGRELWKSDGTANGTALIKDIRPGVFSSSPSKLTNVNGQLCFVANDGTTGSELWKSNGTNAGTTLVKDIKPGSGDSFFFADLENVNGTLFFSGANDGTHGNELWKSNGTALGTVLVKDILAGSVDSSPTYLTNVNGNLYFSANDGANGTELWKSDGTTAGTILIKDIFAGITASNPARLTNVNGTLYFSSQDTSGIELWKSSGTNVGTVQVKDIVSGNVGSYLYNLANLNGTLYFSANDGLIGQELWKSDGTAAGTALIKDIWPAGSSGPTELTTVNGQLYFVANDGVTGFELWKSNGTALGTVIVKDIQTGIVGSAPTHLTNVNGTLYFSANDGANGLELWKSDGTTAGTVLVKNVSAGNTNSNPNYLTNVSGSLYFTANDGVNGTELWKSDGTALGTFLVKVIGSTSNPRFLTNVNGTLFFGANDGTHGYELWKSNGTALGTVLVKDIQSGSVSSAPISLTNVNGDLYFIANDGENGTELWKSDGSAAGTVLVNDIQFGLGNSVPQYLTNANGTLYFIANDGSNGNELWKSDGTAAGTVLVKDIQAGFGSSNPQGLTNLNGWLVFTSNDGVSGEEAWISDGTSQGTRLLADTFAGPGGSVPAKVTQFALAGPSLFFGAVGPSIGKELFASAPVSNFSLANGIVTIDLSGTTSNRSLSVRMNAGQLVITDLTTNTEFLGPNSELPLNAVEGFRIIGSSAFSEQVTVDHSFGGVVNLPKGLEFDGGVGGTDTVTIIGSAGIDAVASQATPDLSIASGIGSTGMTITYRNVESLAMSALRRVSVDGNLSVDVPISVSNQLSLDLGGVTTLAGGSITSNGPVALGSGELIVGSGNIAGRFAGEAGSGIFASGPLTIGTLSSGAGFLTRGELDVAGNIVTLLDANQAVLGSLTSLGNPLSNGNINASNGALIDFGNNLIGFGTLNTPNLSTKPTFINGNVDGTSLAKPVTLAGYVKGVGSLNNVSITGTYSPGFSPAAVTLGNVSYAASSVTIVELGGKLPGSEHDQLNHTGQAQLDGTLDLEIINGYQPVLGSSFTILTATGGITGKFANTLLPTLPSGLKWLVSYAQQTLIVSVIQSNSAPIGIVLQNVVTTLPENTNTTSSIKVADIVVIDDALGTNTLGLIGADAAMFQIVGNGLYLNAGSILNFEVQSQLDVTVTVDDLTVGNSPDATVPYSLVLANLLELNQPIQIGDGTVQRSIVKQVVLSFDAPIVFDSGAFVVQQRKLVAGVIVFQDVVTQATLTSNGLRVILTFSGALTNGFGVLVDGNYQLTIIAAKVRSQASNAALDGDSNGVAGGDFGYGSQAADKFFAMFGDSDGDRDVDAQDYGRFGLTFRKTLASPLYNAAFDYDGDGDVDSQDYGQFGLRYRKSLPFA